MNRNNLIYACAIIFLNCQCRLFHCAPRQYLDDFIEDLQEHVLEQNETECVRTALDLLKSVQNHTLWGTWVWNSMNTSPVGYLSSTQYQLGDYDQCLNPPWVEKHPQLRTQYCLVHIQPKGPHSATDGTEKIISAYSAADAYTHIRLPNVEHQSDIHWGLCLPSSCDTDFIKSFTTVLLRQSYLGSDFTETSITVELCHVAGDRKPTSWVGFCFITTLALLGLVAVISTCVYKKDSDSKVMVIARAFSMKNNIEMLTKSHPEELEELNGLRFMATVAIVSSHHFALPNIFGPIKRLLNFAEIVKSPSVVVLCHYVLCIEYFFVMSGFLLVKYHMTKPLQTHWQHHMKLAIWRFLRFVPMMAVATCMLIVILENTSGPASTTADVMLDHCKKNWWLNFLMLNNYIGSGELCNIVTWTAQTDFQMSIVAMALIYLYNNKRSAGITAFGIVAALSLVLPAITAYIYDIRSFGDVVNRSYPDFIKIDYAQKIYIKAHNRIGPYLIGMALGYVMCGYKRNADKRTLSKKVSIIGAMLGIVMMCVVGELSGYFLQEKRDLVDEVIFSALYRHAYGAGFAILLICLFYGTVPLLNDFLSWKVFRPLSRLSYGISLLHFVLLAKRFANSRVHIAVDMYQDIIDSSGTLVASTILALMTWLLVEAPSSTLCKLLLYSTSPAKTKELKNKRE